MRTLFFSFVTLVWCSTAYARPVHFTGPHPIAARLGGGYCYIEAPHVHAYAPDHPALYHQVGDEHVFTGDPTPFGYDGDKHTFYGHHPIASATGEPIWCYMNGPHFHVGPPPEDGYKVKKGVAFYVGPYNDTYRREKPLKEKVVNAEYRPYVALRPTVEVKPPDEWQGEVYVAAPAPEVDVTVPAPSVEVNAPPPPRVVVNAPPPPRVIVNAPAPPSVDVRVSAPPPPRVVVGVSAPGVVIGAPAPHVIVGAPAPHVVVGAPAPGVIVVGGKRGHHDNGKHKGWYK